MGGRRGHGPVVEALIERGADIHARSNGGTTPLLFAVRKGDMRSGRAMLAAGADVNETRPDLATPLLVAIINGHEDLVDLLLDKGADPNAEGGSTELTVQGMRARPMEIELKTPSYREQLRDVGTEGGNGGNNSWGKPLQAAVHVANWHISDQFIVVNIDRLRVIKSLLAHGADVNGRNTDMEPRWSGARYRRRLVGATAFLSAAKSADVEVMRLLLAARRRSDDQHRPEHHAADGAAGIAWASNQDRAQRGAGARRRQAAGRRAGRRRQLRGRHRRNGDACGGVPRREQRRPVSVRQGREARRGRPRRTDAADRRRWRRVRQFVCGPTAHRGAAAEAGRQGNSVSGPVPNVIPEEALPRRGASDEAR